MNASKANLSILWIVLVSLVVPASYVFAQNDIEDPSHYPGSWYRIAFDRNGDYTKGDGDGYGGGTWYYYPETEWYRQWFSNGSYDPDRVGDLTYEVYIQAVDPCWPTYVEVYMTWTTPEWSALGYDRPPLPDDAPTADEESLYLSGRRVYLVDNWYIGTVEPIVTEIIEEYNPAWVSIDIRGRNAYVYRGVMRECRGKEGACCNPTSGDCFQSAEEDCKAPYKWLGPGTACDKCTVDMTWMDLGDAPDSYGTQLASGGARHIVVEGVFLGRTVDVEADGRPTPAATGDDLHDDDDEDGVAFTSPLSPGASAAVEVTASTQGYLNAWIDFNQDGSFDDAGEQIFQDELLVRGLNKLSFAVPAAAAQGATFARFRFNTRGLLSYNGPAFDGEVEDYQVSIAEYLEPQPNSGKGALKWSQVPQPFDAATPYIFDGWDELSNLHLHQMAADDWQCQDARPVTGFHWWGSFEGWAEPLLPLELPLAFHIAVWTDSPAGAQTSAHPDTLVWETFCTNWTWNIAGFNSDPRRLHDDTCFQFTCLLSQDQWFYPAVTGEPGGAMTPVTYWLSIAAVYDTQAASPRQPWGWTTRLHASGSGAARILEIGRPGAPEASWPPVLGSLWLAGANIEHPKDVAWDLAFELLTNQGAGANDPGLAPVYRFWSDKLSSHFYTIDEAEKNKLINEYSHVWTFEGIAFYAYPPQNAPAASKPVYRFWSEKLGRHFYTMDESEKQKLIDEYAHAWIFEGVVWNAFD